MNKKELLLNIQAVGLLAVDLHLFLDTHPDNKQAFEDYKQVCEHYAHLKDEYEKNFGPLTSSSHLAYQDSDSWVNGPWPWKRQ